MGKGYKSGSGSSELNFRVVAYPSVEAMHAAAPRNNTIGVVTTEKMTGWVVDNIIPTDPVQGMVWIMDGAEGTPVFNAIRKNAIQIHPASAKQYVDGAWQDLPAEICQNGVWIDWTRYLYNQGDECTALTGGWVACDYRLSGSAGYYRKTPDVSKKESSITLHVQGMTWIDDANRNFDGGVVTARAIDVTKYKYLAINVTGLSAADTDSNMTAGGTAKIGVTSALSDYFVPAAQVSLSVKCNQTISGLYFVDVSGISGPVYAFAYLNCPTADRMYLTFDKWYLK